MDTAFLIADRILAPKTLPDDCMQVFRKFSTFSPLSCYVTKNGKEMRYRIMRPARASQFDNRCEEYLKQARLVASVFELPLHPSIDKFVIGNVIIEANLVLTYTGQS